MTFHTKLGLFALVIGAVGMMNVTTVLAADDICARIPVGGGSSILYHDYHLSTQTLTTQPSEGIESFPLFMDSFAGDGSAVSVTRTVGDDGLETDTLRFIDGPTQNAHDVPLRSTSIFAQMDTGYKTGWSPDGEYYAIAVDDPENFASMLTIFTRTGKKVAATTFQSFIGPAFWSWSPQSDRIVMVQGDTSKNADSMLYIGLSIFSVTDELIPVDLPESLAMDYTTTAVATWSPDGRFVAIEDHNRLQLIDGTTGGVTPLSTNHYFEVSDGSEIMWTADSQYLLYLSKTHYDEDATLELLRYNAHTGETTMLIDRVVPTFRFSPPTAGANQRYMAATIQGDSSKSVIVDGITGESRTLGQGQDIYGWLPTGDTLLTRGATGTVIIPIETDDAFQIPADLSEAIVSSVVGSPNGKWLGFSVQDDGGFRLWLMNTKTGDMRDLGPSTDYADVIPADQGVVFAREDARLILRGPDQTDSVLLTDNLSTVYDARAPYGISWSPDGSIGVFGETPLNDVTLHFVQSDGTSLGEVVVPLEGVPPGSIQWVKCDS